MRKLFLFGWLALVGSQQQLFSQACQLQTGTLQGMGQLAKTTGNPMVDASINSELSALYLAFQVRPGFFVLNDAGASNAFAMPDTIQPGTTGTVAFGYYLMNEEFLQSGPINFSISAIMAHEFSHVVQFKHASTLGLTQKELQADYLAGWYVGKRQSGAIVPGSLENIMRSFFEHGSYDFNNPQFHGTPEQRVRAVMNGFRHSDNPLSSAYARAEAYVQDVNVGADSDSNSKGTSSFRGHRDQEIQNSGIDELKRVITLAEHNSLGDLKGERDSDDWKATIKLPFAKFCNIQRESSRKVGHVYVYTCDVASGLDHDEAVEKGGELLKMITEQLSGTIRKTPRDHANSHTEYLQTSGGAYINLRSFESQGAYALWLDIAPPQSD